LGYGISPRAFSWFRSPAGQKTSSMVRVFLVTPPTLEVLVEFEVVVVVMLLEVVEVVELVVDDEGATYAK